MKKEVILPSSEEEYFEYYCEGVNYDTVIGIGFLNADKFYITNQKDSPMIANYENTIKILKHFERLELIRG